MKATNRIALGAMIFSTAGLASAQVSFGYDVSWGNTAVPLSPALTALLVLLLAMSAYGFLRRRAGRASMFLLGALCVGGMLAHADQPAIGGVTTEMITTPAGSLHLTCDTPHYLGTTVPEGVTLTVTPFGVTTGVAPATPKILLPGECKTGTFLSPADVCSLCAVPG
jgi:hypothetical protein